ncbi:circadian clock protein KaiB [Ectothiorhodospiraceae bacterium 2226]|nr:circadian clock protein KaiB [Ectothiorhodospiraceae bacterium 2226]
MKATQAPVALELFVRGQSPHSREAIQLVRRVCETHMPFGYSLEVIDIATQPERVRAAGVMAVPTLVRRRPEPVLSTVGRLDEARVLAGLGLQ